MTTLSRPLHARQLVALTTFSDLVAEAREQVLRDARSARPTMTATLAERWHRRAAYADAVATYLAFALSAELTDYVVTICTWDQRAEMRGVRNTFARQAIPMIWDFAEGQPLQRVRQATWSTACEWVARSLEHLPASAAALVEPARRAAAAAAMSRPLVSRPTRRTTTTSATRTSRTSSTSGSVVRFEASIPTLQHALVAKGPGAGRDAVSFEGDKAEGAGVLRGRAWAQRSSGCAMRQHPRLPVTVYYAFKQAESETMAMAARSVASTGWETMLDGLLRCRLR